LFPTFSSLAGSKAEDRSKELFARSVKYVLLGVGPLVLLFVFYARPFLRLWLGPEFAQRSTLVFQILAVGFLITSLAGIPFNYLQGIGRVAMATKIQALELALYVPLAWGLIKLWGLAGAALALTIKSILITILYFWFSQKVCRIEMAVFAKVNVLRAIYSAALWTVILLIVTRWRWGVWGLLVVSVTMALMCYFYILNREEKIFLRGTLHGAFGRRFLGQKS
jgi:O-antigen/teichoic acid export membrane protein